MVNRSEPKKNAIESSVCTRSAPVPLLSFQHSYRARAVPLLPPLPLLISGSALEAQACISYIPPILFFLGRCITY